METNIRVTEGRFHSYCLKPTFPKDKGGATSQICKRRGQCLEGYQSLSHDPVTTMFLQEAEGMHDITSVHYADLCTG